MVEQKHNYSLDLLRIIICKRQSYYFFIHSSLYFLTSWLSVSMLSFIGTTGESVTLEAQVDPKGFSFSASADAGDTCKQSWWFVEVPLANIKDSFSLSPHWTPDCGEMSFWCLIKQLDTTGQVGSGMNPLLQLWNAEKKSSANSLQCSLCWIFLSGENAAA